jgi:hypothetical protein
LGKTILKKGGLLSRHAGSTFFIASTLLGLKKILPE